MPNVFADSVPELFQSHLEHLLQSAISLDVIRERGYRSVLGQKALEQAGFGRSQRRTPGLLIPLHAPDGSPAGSVYRPDRPRKTGEGKPLKYEAPAGGRARFDMPPRCRQHARDPAVDLWITEGAKKADALASVGLCALNLSGVWGFKGKSDAGGTALLADFDLLAWQGRRVQIAFDSDIVDKPQVRQAMERLREHVERRGAKVHIVRLPAGPDGAKVGVDDYLAAGHTVEELRALVEDLAATPAEDEPMALHSAVYCVHEGRFCVIRQLQALKVKAPLCNFTARVVDEVVLDDGVSESRQFTLAGELAGGVPLPSIEVPAAHFNSLNWVSERWGSRAIIFAGASTRDHLRTIIQLSSESHQAARRVFQHTGWREIEGQRRFLTASGAVGGEGVEVSLPAALSRYCLPQPAAEAGDAVQASLRFLDVARFDVTAPLWASIYLAPLSELLEPAFTLWLSGATGSFKSVLSALALSHFGDFSFSTLPASWRDTANHLQWMLSVAKDLPVVIDDWHPAPTVSGQRDLEYKADIVIRGQGNRSGRGRLRADASPRGKYTPRGVLLSTGEQLPAGESGTARLMVVELERGYVDLTRLTMAQGEAHLYPYAAVGYVLYLRDNWDSVAARLKSQWPAWRQAAMVEDAHLRVPATVAWLYAGADMGLEYAQSCGFISSAWADELRDACWATFLSLGGRQSYRVEEERPAKRFMDTLRTLLSTGRLCLLSREQVKPGPYDVGPRQEFVGWQDEAYVYVVPGAAYQLVYEHCQRSGQPLTTKAPFVWADLARLQLITPGSDRPTTVIRVGGTEGVTRRVVAIRRTALDDSQLAQDS